MPDFPVIDCQHVTKFFGSVQAVRSVSLAIESGQFTALLGPSGCGKTTVLRLIAGLETLSSGTITLNGRLVAGNGHFVPPNQRHIGMVFQDYALFPHLTVEQNIAYGLSDRGSQRRTRVGSMLDLVGLTGLEKRYPHELSGGQQQRTALARALAPQPDILLLDEPFSNLDVALRVQVREDVQRILQAAGVTVILVTHDQAEAMSLADQVALMFDGALEQVGTPRDLYEQPVSRRAAQFVGEANVLEGTAAGPCILTPLGEIPTQAAAQGEVEVLMRPEHLSITTATEGTRARIKRCMYFGTHQDVWVEIDAATQLTVRCAAHEHWDVGEQVGVRVTGPVLVYHKT